MAKKKKPVFQNHHVIYKDSNREVLRRVRRGVHFSISWIRRFSWLTDQEIETIKLEAELKRRFDKENKNGNV